MPRRRLFGAMVLILLLLVGGMVWTGYRSEQMSALDRALIGACAIGDLEQARSLLHRGADPNASLDPNEPMGWRHLLALLLRRHHNTFRIRPLNQAMAIGSLNSHQFEIVQLLLAHHADPNIELASGDPLALHALTDPSADRLFPLFLQHGVNPNLADTYGISLLMVALMAHRAAWAQALLERGAKPDMATRHGDTALMWAAQAWDVPGLKLLLAHGADVNHKNKEGQPALTYALANVGPEQKPTIEALLAAGADVNLPDNQGCTPFLFALVEHGYGIEAMLAHGADMRRTIPLSAPRVTISTEVLARNSAITSTFIFSPVPGTTPLMFAVQSREVALIRAILAKGADVNARNAQGKTALSYAADSLQVRTLLQRAGARL
jgi:ankyrin repeat protein